MDPHYHDHDPETCNNPAHDHYHEHPPIEPPIDPGYRPFTDFQNEQSAPPSAQYNTQDPYWMDRSRPDYYDDGSDDSEEEGKKPRAVNNLAGQDKPLDYHFRTQNDLGIYSSLIELTEAGLDAAFKLIKTGITNAKNKKELANYEDLYQKVLKKPEDYSVLTINGDLMDADAFAKVLKENFGTKAEVFETMDNTILVSRKDRDKVFEAAKKISNHPELYTSASKDGNTKGIGQTDVEQDIEDQADDRRRISGRSKADDDEKGEAADEKNPLDRTEDQEDDIPLPGLAGPTFDDDDDDKQQKQRRGERNERRRAGKGNRAATGREIGEDTNSGDIDGTSALTGGSDIDGIGDAKTDDAPVISSATTDSEEHAAVGTWEKNRQSLSGQGHGVAAKNHLRDTDANQALNNTARKKVLSVSEVTVKSNPQYRDDKLRNFARGTDGLQVAMINMGGSMLASAGKDDPAVQQLRGGIDKIKTVNAIVNQTSFGARGAAKAAQLRAQNLTKKADAATFNAMKRYASTKGVGVSPELMVRNLHRDGIIKNVAGNRISIDRKRLYNEVLGPNATKEQKKQLRKIVSAVEEKNYYQRQYKSSRNALKNRIRHKFTSMDDGTRAMGQMTDYIKKGVKGTVNGVRWTKNTVNNIAAKRAEKRGIEAADPYRERFRKQQASRLSKSKGNTVGGVLEGEGNLLGGESLTRGTGLPGKREIKTGPKSGSEGRRKLRLRQDVEGGGIRNSVNRGALRTSDARSRIGVRKVVKSAIAKVTAPLNPARKFFKKAGEVWNKATSPVRFIIELPARVLRIALGFFAKAMFVYILVCFIMMVMAYSFSSAATIVSMALKDTWQEKIGELFTVPSAESIAGKVYYELRYSEIEWASSLRALGTNESKLLVSNITYTDQGWELEDYLNSEAGVADYLGAFAVSNEEYKKDYRYTEGENAGEVKSGVTIGVQGPQPFEGAGLNEYKLISAIDGGNQLEITGKPMDGWTSNAKEVISMSVVFYQQMIEEITDDSEFATGAELFWKTTKTVLKGVLEKIGNSGIPILGEVAGESTWTYTGLMRNYAYPLFTNSRYSDFYLSTYLYPTKWTNPGLKEGTANAGNEDYSEGTKREGARYDSNQGTKEPGEGDEALLDGKSDGGQKSHSTVGTSKSGGSGKADSQNYVSTNYWGSLGNSDYQGFETCADAIANYDSNKQASAAYNGYGCQLRYTFSQKWEHSFGTNKDGELANEEASGINKLHYGEADLDWNEKNEGDTDGELADEENNNVKWHKTGQDVSSDVSPYYEDGDVEQQYNEDSCLVFPTEMSDRAWSCWEILSEQETYSGKPTHDLDGKSWKADCAKKSFSSFEDNKYRLDHIDANGESGISFEEGFIVWFYLPEYELRTDENGIEYEKDVSDEVGVTFIGVKVKHNCVGKHEGVYCGGHAQLRTRGVVIGFSESQVTDGDPTEATSTSKTSNYDPKFLDPDTLELDKEKYGEAKDIYGDAIEAFDAESDKYSNNTILTDNAGLLMIAGGFIGAVVGAYHALSAGPVGYVIGGIVGSILGSLAGQEIKTAATGIPVKNQYLVKEARDLFDIDVLIKRPTDSYLKKGDEDEEVYWTSWTATNMGQAISLAMQDWKDLYDVVDTQTIVGGQIDVNSLDSDTAQNILNQLGWDDIKTGIDITSGQSVTNLINERGGESYTIETESGVTINGIDEEISYLNRLRHIKYAMSLVGQVSYNQDMHTYLWGNLSGHQTDCSGFTSNVWRDALGLTGSTGALSTYALYDLAEENGALHSLSGSNIEASDIMPGDIILTNSSGEETDAAHALIYVGMLDESQMYVDQDGTVDNQEHTWEAKSDGTKRPYTIDCSTMTITTETFKENAPNKLLLSKALPGAGEINLYSNHESKSITGYDTTTGETQYGSGVQKVRSGNTRFAVRSYLEGDISGDIVYIDMDALGKALGHYTTGDGHSLQCDNGVLTNDFTNMEKSDNGQLYPGKNHEDYKTASATTFWDLTTSKHADKETRKTVVLEMNQGTQAEKAGATNITAPPNDNGDPVEDDPEREEIIPGTEPSIVHLKDGRYKVTWAAGYDEDGNIIYKSVIYDGQGEIYSNYISGTGSRSGAVGCGYYALQAAMTAITGKYYDSKTIFDWCKIYSNPNGFTLADYTANKALAKIGISCNDRGWQSKDYVDQQLKQGKVVTVRSTYYSDKGRVLHRAHADKNDEGHWVTIVGIDINGRYIVTGNQSGVGGGSYSISPSQMPDKFQHVITYNYSPK